MIIVKYLAIFSAGKYCQKFVYAGDALSQERGIGNIGRFRFRQHQAFPDAWKYTGLPVSPAPRVSGRLEIYRVSGFTGTMRFRVIGNIRPFRSRRHHALPGVWKYTEFPVSPAPCVSERLEIYGGVRFRRHHAFPVFHGASRFNCPLYFQQTSRAWCTPIQVSSIFPTGFPDMVHPDSGSPYISNGLPGHGASRFRFPVYFRPS